MEIRLAQAGWFSGLQENGIGLIDRYRPPNTSNNNTASTSDFNEKNIYRPDL